MKAPDDRSQPLVSIGVAVYNGGATLARALDSLIQQDYPNIEIIVSDDCSTDDSRQLIAAYQQRDTRIRVLNNEANIGLIANFNKVFHAARGEYFFWADQDDARHPTFVRKTLQALEQDAQAVLCHAHTANFIRDPANVLAIVTLDGVAGRRGVLRRYWSFLRRYTDTTIYGLIRVDALRNTRLWRADLGSANALLFQLLLQGHFLQVPEVLYWYQAKGLRNRPSVAEEYARSNAGRPMPRLYLPFLRLAMNQSRDICASRLSIIDRASLLALLWAHVAMVNAAKATYRLTHWMMSGRVPARVRRACESLLAEESHVTYLSNSDSPNGEFPRGWALKGGR